MDVLSQSCRSTRFSLILHHFLPLSSLYAPTFEISPAAITGYDIAALTSHRLPSFFRAEHSPSSSRRSPFILHPTGPRGKHLAAPPQAFTAGCRSKPALQAHRTMPSVYWQSVLHHVQRLHNSLSLPRPSMRHSCGVPKNLSKCFVAFCLPLISRCIREGRRRAVRLSLRKAVRSGSADAKTNGSRISHESWEPHIS